MTEIELLSERTMIQTDLSPWPITLQDESLVKTDALINGQWVSASDDAVFEVDNPASEECIAKIACCAEAEAKDAVLAAHNAFIDWRATPVKQRAALLRDWYNLILENQDDLAKILTLEQGKPLNEALGEIAYGASYIEWFAEEAKRICGDVIAPSSPDKRVLTLREPIGVVACITPWNFPNAMLSRKIAPALAAGCTVVCKPANETPLSAMALGELALRAGIPTGVINILCGKTDEIGQVLTSDPLVKKLSFTGSTKVGKMLVKRCADTMKRTSMELGGNAPFIVFDDADIDHVVSEALAGKLRNSGQTCISPNRFFVQKSVHEKFIQKLTACFEEQIVGPGYESGVTSGPLITQQAVEKVFTLVEEARSKGAKLDCGHSIHKDLPRAMLPTVLSEVNSSMAILHEEIFGPVAVIVSFEEEADVISMANDTPYGLAAYVFTKDYQRIWRLAEALEYGMVGVNTAVISNEMMPFGGTKESGHGREGSKYGLDDYLEIKSVCLGL